MYAACLAHSNYTWWWLMWAMAAKRKTKDYFSGKLWHVVLLHDGNHNSMDRIFVSLCWELYCQWQSDRAINSRDNDGQQEDKRVQNSTTKVSFCKIVTHFESVHDGDCDSVVRIFVGLSCKLWGFINYLIVPCYTPDVKKMLACNGM